MKKLSIIILTAFFLYGCNMHISPEPITDPEPQISSLVVTDCGIPDPGGAIYSILPAVESIYILGDNVTSYCCFTYHNSRVELDGNVINFYSTRYLDTEEDSLCKCICAMDISAAIEHIQPGSYTVNIYVGTQWNTYLVHEQVVIVN